MAALVFGRADPARYTAPEPDCICGHSRAAHREVGCVGPFRGAADLDRSCRCLAYELEGDEPCELHGDQCPGSETLCLGEPEQGGIDPDPGPTDG